MEPVGYVIKYALSVGIYAVYDVEASGEYVYCKIPGALFRLQAKEGHDFFRKPEDAEAAAKKMALRKIKSLENQITRLRVLAEKSKWVRHDGHDAWL